jgi:hypothetical protein
MTRVLVLLAALPPGPAAGQHRPPARVAFGCRSDRPSRCEQIQVDDEKQIEVLGTPD